MYRITLTDEQRWDLQHRTPAPGLAAATRDRLAMIRLSDAGWRVPKIARHLGLHEQTVRAWIKVFLAPPLCGLAEQTLCPPALGSHAAGPHGGAHDAAGERAHLDRRATGRLAGARTWPPIKCLPRALPLAPRRVELPAHLALVAP